VQLPTVYHVGNLFCPHPPSRRCKAIDNGFLYLHHPNLANIFADHNRSDENRQFFARTMLISVCNTRKTTPFGPKIAHFCPNDARKRILKMRPDHALERFYTFAQISFISRGM
jgi:hypothetical protein